MRERIILSLYDYSGRWSEPYREAGYTVVQADLKLGQDVRLLKYAATNNIWGILSAPPCTEFAVSGARWWREKEAKGNQPLLDAIAMVDAVLRMVVLYKPKWWVLENPVGRAKDWIGQSVFTFNPCDYAGWNTTDMREDMYTKRTCLWGEFNEPEKKWLPPVDGSKMHKMYGGKSEKTKELRSLTPRGFARAFFAANP